MKLTHRIALAAVVVSTLALTPASAEELVILHTNDTHSQLDPAADGLGGVARRKVLVDSVRASRPNVLLIDAGDAVQGTMYFNLYRGEPEHKIMNLLDYDIAILGNHEFDNGVRELAENIRRDSATWLTTNYDLRDSELDGLFVPYVIKEFGGRKIGFIGINLEPKGMIAEGNYDGVAYLDAFKAANSTAWCLKHLEGADMVVAVTHIGYDGGPGPRDVDLAANSEDIDIIIGGHSHTTLNPAPTVANLNGKEVLVTQTGSKGASLGEITIDLDSLTAVSRLIPVDCRLDSRIDSTTTALLAPYRHTVDSVMNIKVARSAVELDANRLGNLISDYVLARGKELAGEADLAIVNKGGIRRTLPKGDITRGMVIMTLPFENRVTVMEIKGADLADALDVMAGRGGDVVSKGVDATFDPATGKCTSVTVDGVALDPEKTYRLATIDYLANGGDYMSPLTKGQVIARSDRILYEDIIDQMHKAGRRKLSPSNEKRMHP